MYSYSYSYSEYKNRDFDMTIWVDVDTKIVNEIVLISSISVGTFIAFDSYLDKL